MIDAAVALEAYMDDNQNPVEEFDASNPMVHPHWYGYQKRLGASEWHTLFDDTDYRSSLTWRNRFANLPDGINYFNFYSSGEEVLDTHTDNPGLIDIATDGVGRYAWALQEKLKGEMGTGLVLGSSYGGWGFNLGYYVLPDKSAANALTTEMLKINPFFRLGSAAELAENNGSQYAHDNHTKLLAEAFPALTLPAGGPEGQGIETEFLQQNVKNMQTEFAKTDWPSERGGSAKKKWLHSDLRNVAYPYIYKIFEDMTAK